MIIKEIEEKIEKLIDKNIDKNSFIFDLLLAYGLPKSSITRLKKGSFNLSKTEDVILWKKKLLFKEIDSDKLLSTIEELKGDSRVNAQNPRFIIVTNYKQFVAYDTKTKDSLDIKWEDIKIHFDFFLPWAGMEKTQYQSENPADVKAAERMAKLFDQIKNDNPSKKDIKSHELNVFLIRLLFCFFAEDTQIFNEGIFTNLISSHTQKDGSDLAEYLERVFDVLNTSEDDRENLPEYLSQFPYVNGGLFKEKYSIPEFSSKSRQLILESGQLNWSQINPDIFGSMMQAVVDEDNRNGLGMHYTSVPNIMKVIEPLFLDELKEKFENARGNKKKLSELQLRLSKIKIFDPACGSGNFLIIAYKELRRLEMNIIKELGKFSFSEIHLSNFYGIEIDDFACEVAKLSLWLAEHQMNIEFKGMFGRTNPTLPLKEAGNIVNGNACRLDWEEVCPKNENDEIYVLGNPPYVGYSRQSKKQKEDMQFVFQNVSDSFKKLDYISIWFYKSAEYGMNISEFEFAFVTTNSITQGEQVVLMWPLILNLGYEIVFAYKSFPWTNNAKNKAMVFVVITGLKMQNKPHKKKLYSETGVLNVYHINPYLVSNTQNTIVQALNKSISNLPQMIKGSAPVDGGFLIFSESEYKQALINDLRLEKYCMRYVGANEFMNNIIRYILRINIEDIKNAIEVSEIRTRLDKVSSFRESSKKDSTRKLSKKPYQFGEDRYQSKNSILIPQTGSERRDYIPIGFYGPNYIISNAARVIYTHENWLFSVLSSTFNLLWVKAVAGRLKMDMQYSNTLCYNTFPFPQITESKKKELTENVYRILEEREKHSEKTLAQLYDPNKMPEGLREAHRLNDLAVERCYRSKPFESDEERLEYLFKMYEEMVDEK